MAMPKPDRLIVRSRADLVVVPDVLVQRLGALVLSLLDRAGVPPAGFTRIVIHGQRLVVFHLPFADSEIAGLHLDARLQYHTGFTARLIGHTAGSALVIDLRTIYSNEGEHHD